MSDDKRAQALELVRMALRVAEVETADLPSLLVEALGPVPEVRAPVTFAEFVPMALGSLDHNSMRTYCTHLMRLIDGVPDICDCTCTACCLSVVVAADAWIPPDPRRQRRTAPGHCQGKRCQSRTSLPAIGQVIVSERAFCDVYTAHTPSNTGRTQRVASLTGVPCSTTPLVTVRA
jgi:hypothetical protein